MNKQETVYYFQAGKVHSCSYEEFVNEFGEDLTTSPKGVMNREFIRFREMWELCTWGIGGNNLRVLERYETEEEAEDALFQSKEHYMERNHNTPRFCYSPSEALEFEFNVSTEVAESIYRKMLRVEKRRGELQHEYTLKQDEERKKQIEKEKQARISAGLPEDKIEATKAQWTDEMVEKFKQYLDRKGINVISNRIANSIAWKKQNWFIGGADVVTLRGLLKRTFR